VTKASKRVIERQRRRMRQYYAVGGAVLAVSAIATALTVFAPGPNTHPDGQLTGYAIINTASGQIVFKFLETETPITCAQFITLFRGGYYNGLTWHRVVENFVIQTGQGASRSTIPLELNPNLHNDLGFVGVARTDDPNSGSTQFYINKANNRNLDTTGGGYTVFGQVTRGMEIVQRVTQDELIYNATFVRSATPP